MKPDVRRHVKYFKNSPSLKFLFFFTIHFLFQLTIFFFFFPLTGVDVGNHLLTSRGRRNSLGAPTGPTRVFSLFVHVTRHALQRHADSCQHQCHGEHAGYHPRLLSTLV